jgi:hypothetical protein
LTILSIASKNFFSSEFDQGDDVFFGEEVVGEIGAKSDLSFLGVVGVLSDGRLGGIFSRRVKMEEARRS